MSVTGLEHLCMGEFATAKGPHSMRELYALLGVEPASVAADTILVRSHIAYHCGHAEAARAVITKTRGQKYRVTGLHWWYNGAIVTIHDRFDHRNGLEMRDR